MNSNILIASDIHKSFGGVDALKGVRFKVSQQEIHCLIGENGSGKSTFVKIVAGVHQPDKGEIVLNNKKYRKLSVEEAINEGVQVIYQDMSLFSNMSVVENIALSKFIYNKRNFVNWKEARKIAEQQLDRISARIDLNAQVETLSIAQKQLVAICRALSFNAKIVFMDEPTTALTKKEIDNLLSVVMDLKKEGLSIVFISHKLEEVTKIADRVAIFRDGEMVGDFDNKEVNEKMLIYHMTGREIEYTGYTRRSTNNKPIMRINNLTKKGNYTNVNFDVCEGDIVGIIGTLGSGRTELALSLFGLNPHEFGQIYFHEQLIRPKTPKQVVRKGIALIPENRQSQGCFLQKSVLENVTAVILNKVSNGLGIINHALLSEITSKIIKELKIVAKDSNTETQNLSGGNQQKVVLGKWIASKSKLLIFDSPTVGVDVGSKAEIYLHIQQLADRGAGIIIISDEIPEVLANCNKLIIMKNGKILAQLYEDELKSSDSAVKINEILNTI